MGENISQSLLSQSNEDRDYHIFDEFTFYMIKLVRQKQVTDIFHLEDSVYGKLPILGYPLLDGRQQAPV